MSTATNFDDNLFGLDAVDDIVMGRPNDGRAVREFQVDVTMTIAGFDVTAFAEQISSVDILVGTYDQPPIGSELPIAFNLPGKGRVELQARVTWYCDEGDSLTLLPGIGLTFVDPPADVRSAIETFVKAPRGLFGL